MQKQADVTMSFASFVELYEKDIRPSLKKILGLQKSICLVFDEVMSLDDLEEFSNDLQEAVKYTVDE